MANGIILALIILALYIANSFLCLFIALRDAQRPLQALTFVIVNLILPFLGFAAYWLFFRHLPLKGRLNQRFKSFKENSLNANAAFSRSLSSGKPCLPSGFLSSTEQLAQWARAVSGMSPTYGAVRVFNHGKDKIAALSEDLKDAKKIDMEYFIYRNDGTGRRITAQLLECAKSGAKIRFLRDGLGSRSLPASVLRRMSEHGIQVRTIHPLRFPWLTDRLNYRDHSKIVSIDEKVVFTGGMNIGDEYQGMDPKIGPWRDTHLSLSGPCISQLQQIFDRHWNAGTPLPSPATFRSKTPRAKAQNHTKTQRHSLLTEVAIELGSVHTSHQKKPKESPQSNAVLARIQTLDSVPRSPVQVIRDLFFLCATAAQKSLDITTPYFIPDAAILSALKTSATRGVSIRLIVPGRPDHPVVGWASTTFLADLIESGVSVYFYEGAVLHAKVQILDGEAAVVGAANYDLRSFRDNYEICQVLYGHEVCHVLAEQFETDLANSRLATLQELERLPRWKKIRNSGARLLAPLL